MPRFVPATYDLSVIRGNLFEQSFELPLILPPEVYRFECQVRLAGTTNPVIAFTSADGSIKKMVRLSRFTLRLIACEKFSLASIAMI
ncbi:hypothetical protein BWI97_07230 [Siphonobacter sp. BAB-5405]|uniref:hypothetical protein n=1 Tax=Siphonobacter sp. BAB-5405 TaxID=1864825 RepID=UPI000C80459D|nr:hypothetical protein [Siphonobacter sp. BAB-5405]PMD97415.1 hypothetical protein BWI97_07230 [Siphonobacter sp. BAB-5405]